MKTIIIAAALSSLVLHAKAHINCKTHGHTTVASSKSIQQFTFFRVHRQAFDASVNWGIANPVVVVHFVIERSYDGSNFEPIAEVPATMSGSYRFRDETVEPGFIHYRVTAHQHDGSSITSEVQVLRIVSRK